MGLDRSHEQKSDKVTGTRQLARVDVQCEETRRDKDGGESALSLGWSGEQGLQQEG